MNEGKRLSSVALLTDGVYPFVTGGMQKHSYYLLKYLLKMNVKVLLYHCTDDTEATILSELDGSLHDLLTEVVIPFPAAGKRPDSYLINSRKYSAAIAADLKTRKRPQFIYAQGFTAWELLSDTENASDRPPVGVNFHGFEMFQYAKGVRSKLIQRMFRVPVSFNCREADVVYSLGGKLTEIAGRLTTTEHLSEISIGIEREWLRREDTIVQEQGPLRVAFIGRFERRKGVVELNSVMKKMAADQIEFVLIGPIPEANQLNQENVSYAGLIREEEKIKSILDSAQVLVVPSLAEGMPTVILEAMARGCAILASDVGAVAEQVDKNNGRLMEAGDEEQLYRYLCELVELDHAELRQMRASSRLKVERKFLWDSVIESTISDIENRFIASDRSGK